MDLVKLNWQTFEAGDLVENVSSLIWTERYNTDSSFEAKFANIPRTLEMLNPGDLLSTLDSREIMIYENLDIDESVKGPPVLKISGRSITSIFEHRVLEGPYGKKFRTPYSLNNYEVILLLIWNSVVNGTNQDATKAATSWFHDARDQIGNTLAVADARVPADAFEILDMPSRFRWLQPGQVAPEIQRLLKESRLGLKVVRPVPYDDLQAYQFQASTAAATKGSPSFQWTYDGLTKARFEVFSGVDRTDGNGSVKPVIYSASAGHLLDTKYFKSIKDWKTTARVMSNQGPRTVNRNSDQGAYFGLDRRVLYVDGGSKDDDETATDFIDSLKDLGKASLEDKTKIIMMDTQIRERFDMGYNNGDFAVGDIITVVGKYGFQEDFRIMEYVRSKDSNGVTGYPVLGTPETMDDT